MSQVRSDSTSAAEICNRSMKIGMNGVRMETCMQKHWRKQQNKD